MFPVGGLAQKQETVEALKAEIGVSNAAFVMDYRGLTVAELTELRRSLYQEGAKLTVAKNTLMRRAVQGTSWSVLATHLKGPSAIAFSTQDQVKPAKILFEFLKKNKKTNSIPVGYLDGKVLSASEVEALSKLPPIEELRAKLVGGIAYPVNSLVMAISGPQRSLVNVLDQFAKLKQSQAQS